MSVFSAISCFSFLLSLSLSLLLSPSLFLLGLILFIPKVNKLISLLLPHLLLALVVFSHSLFHSLALCVSVFLFLPPPPALLSASSSSPLGFSPVERLNSEGNDRVTAFDGAESFLVMEAWNKLITCVWEILRVLTKRGVKAWLRDEGGNRWKICVKVCWGKLHECKEGGVCLCFKTWCCKFFSFCLDFLYVKECCGSYFFYQQNNNTVLWVYFTG